MITEKDLKGEIKNYPLKVVEIMLQRQQEQGNKRDITVFQERPDTGKYGGGFSWNKSIEGSSIWSKVINYNDFNALFHFHGIDSIPELPVDCYEMAKMEHEEIGTINPFESESKELESLQVGDRILVIQEKAKRNMVFLGKLTDTLIMYSTRPMYERMLEKGDSCRIGITDTYTVLSKLKVVELTLEDISKGKGVGIPPHLIKIVDSTGK